MLVSQALAGLLPSTTYYYRAVAEDATSPVTAGPIQSFTTSPLPPTASTGTASAVTDTTVTLAGILDGMGADTHYYFNYGTQPSYGATSPSEAPAQAADAGVISSEHTEEATLTALTPNTTYYYQFVAFNATRCSQALPGLPISCSPPSNIAFGSTGEFTTLPLPPLVTTDPPVMIAASTAILGGEVVAQGSPTSFRIEYGPTATYGQSAPVAEASAGSSVAGQLVTIELTGLLPATEYHYRLLATNSGGTEAGHDRDFTTDAEVPGNSQPLPVTASLTGAAPSAPAVTVFPDLTAEIPAVSSTPTTTIKKPPTRAQKLAAALRVCKRQKTKSKRSSCQTIARRKFGAKSTRH